MTKFKEQEQQELKIFSQKSYVVSELNGRLDLQSEQEKQAKKRTDKTAENHQDIFNILSELPYSIDPSILKASNISVLLNAENLAIMAEMLARKDVKDWHEKTNRSFDKSKADTFLFNVIDVVKGMDTIKDIENSTLSERWMIISSAVQQIFGDENSKIAPRDYITAIQKLENTKDERIRIGGAYSYRRKADVPLDTYIRIATEKSEQDPTKRHYLNFVEQLEKQYYQITDKKLTRQEIFKTSDYEASQKIDFAAFPYTATEEETKNWLKANQAWLKYIAKVSETSKDNKPNVPILGPGIKFDNKQVQEFENLLKVHEKHKSNGLEDYTPIGFKNTTPPVEIMATLEEYLSASDDLELVIKGLLALNQPNQSKIAMSDVMNILPERIHSVPTDTKNTEPSKNPFATIEFVKSLGQNFDETFQPIVDLWIKYFNEKSEQGENKTITNKTVLQELGRKRGFSSDEIKLLATINTEIPQLMRYAETLKQYNPVDDGVVPMNYLKRLIEDPLLQDLQLFDDVWKRLNNLEESLQRQLGDESSVKLEFKEFSIKNKEDLNQLNEILSLENVQENLRNAVLRSSYQGLENEVISVMKVLKERSPKVQESLLYQELKSGLDTFLSFNIDQINGIDPTNRATTVITTYMRLFKLQQEFK